MFGTRNTSLFWLLLLGGCSGSEPSTDQPVLDAGSDVRDAAAGDATPDKAETSVDAGDATSDIAKDGPSDVVGDMMSDVLSDAEDGGGDVWGELGPGVWVKPARPAPGDTLSIRYEGVLAAGPPGAPSQSRVVRGRPAP